MQSMFCLSAEMNLKQGIYKLKNMSDSLEKILPLEKIHELISTIKKEWNTDDTDETDLR